MTDKKINPETPRDLRKKGQRIKEGRDTLKEKNKEKSVDLMKLRGALEDLKESRNSWKAQYEKAAANNIKLIGDIRSFRYFNSGLLAFISWIQI